MTPEELQQAEQLALENCAQEEIRLPGSIQTHGYLLAFDPATEKIVVASENAVSHLGYAMRLILGAPLEAVLDRGAMGAVRGLGAKNRAAGTVRYLGDFDVRGELSSIVAHDVAGLRVLEIEKLDRLVSPELMNDVITNFVGGLGKMSDPMDLCRAMARQVFELSGMDRVLLYRFDSEGHGTVLAEENNGVLPSYLGLRFPATDIPPQARQLYVLNTVRIIPDANYTPSPLTGLAGTDARGMDLSYSVLRSVSPIHTEYMRNMGTAASMSVSILFEGRLWGLISAHNHAPHSVPYLVRSACDLLSKMGGTRLEALTTERRLQEMVGFHAVQRDVLTLLAAEPEYAPALLSQAAMLMRVTDASGCVVLLDEDIAAAGKTPPRDAILALIEWLDTQQDEVFVTRELRKQFPAAEDWTAVASGLLAIRTSKVRRGYVLWFRPEVVETVTWAGEPKKAFDDAMRLSPRKSFESWKQTLRGISLRWSEMEIESARDFRNALQTISLKRAEEAAELSESRFLRLTHALAALVFSADNAGHLTYVNEGWRRQGFAASGLWYEAAGIHPGELQRVRQRWDGLAADSDLFEDEAQLSSSAGGGDRWHFIRVVTYPRPDGSRAGWVGTLTDMTDRREREIALRMADKLATTGRMTSVIAHEINNPLESITNLNYLLRSELEGNTAAQKYLGMAEHELERISAITKQTLRWAREARPTAELATAALLWEEVLRLFVGKIRNRTVQVELIGGGSVEVYGVVPQIRQVLTNLVGNAIEAVPVGGRIELMAAQEGAGSVLTVRDYGPGIAASIRAKLFQPFFSTKGDLGNGLGLYISQEIAVQHGGSLEVDSTPGQGTSMRLHLPGPPTDAGL